MLAIYTLHLDEISDYIQAHPGVINATAQPGPTLIISNIEPDSSLISVINKYLGRRAPFVSSTCRKVKKWF